MQLEVAVLRIRCGAVRGRIARSERRAIRLFLEFA
jgi:hypothetical protein